MTDHQSTTTYEYHTYIVLPLRKDKHSAKKLQQPKIQQPNSLNMSFAGIQQKYGQKTSWWWIVLPLNDNQHGVSLTYDEHNPHWY